MKHTLLILLTIFPMWVSASEGQAPLFPGGSEEDGTRIRLWIPGLLIKASGGIVKQHAPEAAPFVRMVGSTTIYVAEGNRKTDKHDLKAGRLMNRLRNATPLVEVHTATEHVQIVMKQKRGKIRKLAVTVVEEETFVHVRMRCRIDPKKLGELIKSTGTETIPSLQGVIML